jgi:glycosyltransferase involved in cell wall biosynthesis
VKILIFTASDSSFNSIRPEGEIYIELAKRGHQITVITHANSEYGKRYAKNHITVVDDAPKKKISRKSIAIVKNELANGAYDILYATNSKSIPNAAFGAIGHKVKLVTYRGTTGGLYRHDPTAYLTHLHPRVDGVICVSDAVRKDVESKVWSQKKHIVTIHKGHSLQWYDKPNANLKEFGIAHDDFVVVCAVNARPSKGLSVMLEAASMLADISKLHLLLVGKNIDKAPYSGIISCSPLKDRIHLTGYRQDAPELIAASDVLVQPSVSGEGLPRAMMEAMCVGTPCIITDTGGGKEVVEDGVTGFIVPTKNAEAIANRVRKLYGDEKLKNNMAMLAKKKVANDVSINLTADKYVSYFEGLIAK